MFSSISNYLLLSGQQKSTEAELMKIMGNSVVICGFRSVIAYLMIGLVLIGDSPISVKELNL